MTGDASPGVAGIAGQPAAPLGVGIVGCGWAATDIARAIDALPDGHVAAMYDPDRARTAELAGRYGGTVHDTLDALLDDPAVDIVYVGTPHNILAPTAARALAAGRHVLVEKPVALDVASVAELKLLAEERGRCLGVVLELRESGPVRQAKSLIDAGAIGAVRSVRIRTIIDKPAGYWTTGPRGELGWRAWRAQAGGGVVLMNSIHQLDLVRFVTGLTFVRALADVATQTAAVEVEDCAAAVLRLSNGALVSLVANAHSPGAAYEERIEIDGADGRLDLPDPYQPGVLRVFLRRPWRDLPAGRWVDVDADTVDTYIELVRGYLRAVRAGSPPPAGADDASAAVATVLAIYGSAESGKAVDV